jgi:hypothetical protein
MSDENQVSDGAKKPCSSQSADADPIVDKQVDEVDAPVEQKMPAGESTGTATGDVAPGAAAPSAVGVQVVYVTAPVPPRARSNRMVGVLLALVGAVLFALASLGVVVLMLMHLTAPGSVAEEITQFVTGASFWVPILFFAIGFMLIVMLLNRASWWVHVLGSLAVALIVYFGTIGVLLLINDVVVLTSTTASSEFSSLAVNPVIIASALVAREVSIWMGFLIAVCGRRVTARNVEARVAFDHEQAEKKAEIEQKAAQGWPPSAHSLSQRSGSGSSSPLA